MRSFAFLMLLAGVAADLFVGDPDVVKLTDFSALMQSPQVWVILFYKPSDENSKKIAPEFSSAASSLSGIAQLAVVDSSKESEIAQHYGQQVPSILLFPSDLEERDAGDGQMVLTKIPVPYSGGGSAAALKGWVTSNIPDKHILRVNNLEAHEDFLDGFKNDDMQHVILFTDKPKVPMLYRAVSLDLRYRMLFAVAGGGEQDWQNFLGEKYNVTKRPTVIARPPFEKEGQSGGEWITYPGELNHDALLAWLEPMALPQESMGADIIHRERALMSKLHQKAKDSAMKDKVVPLAQVMDRDGLEQVCFRGRSCAVAHLDGQEKWLGQKIETLKEASEALAKKGRLMPFVWVDAAQTSVLHDLFDIGSVGGLPSVSFLSQTSDGWRYTNLRGSFGAKSIQTFTLQSVGKGGRTFDPESVPDFSTDEVEVSEPSTEDE